jgi:hypothetical protein
MQWAFWTERADGAQNYQSPSKVLSHTDFEAKVWEKRCREAEFNPA